MENKGLQYLNKYIPTDVFKGSKNVNQQEEFKKFFLKKKNVNQKKRLQKFLENKPKPDLLGKIPQHILTTPDHHYRKFLNNDLMSTNSVDFTTETDFDHTDKNTLNTDEYRYIQPIRNLIHIDSRDRDLTIYPKPNNYKISLNHTFSNVKRISLRSTEFPNSVQLIKNTPIAQANNNIFWQDEGDSTIYSATLEPGNYQPTSLAKEIQIQMNSIPTIAGENHNFTVIIDQVTDTVTFSSFKITGANGVLNATPSEQGIITVELPTPHGYSTGDTITVSNGTAFGNIPSSEINGEKTITVVGLVNSRVFTYPISNNIIIQNESTGEGGNIEFAKGSNFRLLFDAVEFSNTPVDILGFKSENTIYATSHSNTTIAESFAISDIYPLDSTFSVVVLHKNHEIPQGNEVRFTNITEFSDDVNELFTEGIGYKILPLTDEDVTTLQTFNFNPTHRTRAFKIALNISGETNQSFASQVFISNTITIDEEFVGIGISKLYPIITGLYPYVIGFTNFVAIEMDGVHGFENGQIITILDVPSLGNNQTYSVSALTENDLDELRNIALSNSNYDIFNTETSFTRFFKISVNTGVPYTKYYRNMSPEFFEFQEFPNDFAGAVPVGLRNEPSAFYLMQLDFNHIDEGFPIEAVTADDLLILEALKAVNPLLNINVNFKVRTNEPIQKNVNAVTYNGQYSFTRTINKPIVLSGENYIFMTSPIVDNLGNTGAMKNTGIVSNIFAKVTLSAPPGSIIFNSYISNPIIYDDSPLVELSEMEFSFRDKNNELFEFNDTDHSFTLEIIEYRDKLLYNDFDSRRGRYDNVRMRQNTYS